MNFDILLQLVAIGAVVVAGPMIIVLLYARSGNL
jgi:hypothetical protein